MSLKTLGASLKREFDDNAAKRRSVEQRWLSDLRMYKGRYDPETERKIGENRSRVFIRKVSSKVNGTLSRLMDLLFPAKGDRNWDIQPSSNPEVHPALFFEAVSMETLAAGKEPNEKRIREIRKELAEDAAAQMGRLMEDQLAEAPGRPSYRNISESVIFQGCLYGTGCMKGPLVERRPKEKWAYDPASESWALTRIEGELHAHREFVSIWNVFPDLDAIEPHQLRFVWQSHLKTAKELQELMDWPSFDEEAIRRHMKDNPDGDAKPEPYETDIRMESDSDNVPTDFKGRFRLYERWGYISGRELRDAGLEIVEEAAQDEVYSTNFWLLGDTIVKAVLSPIEGVDIPYYWWFYSKDETEFFPEGIASILNDPQRAFNAAVRMLLDNAAMSSGPIIGINSSVLRPGQDPTNIRPWQVWEFQNVEDLRQVFTVFDLPNNSAELMNIARLMSDWADDQTTPRFMAGDGGNVKGAGETASGLSMLMSAANVVLKTLVRSFDDGITRPFIKALYYWNMKFSERDEIKGDFVIKAIGSTALIAKEIQSERMLRAVQITDNPRFAGRVDDGKLLSDIFRVMELDDGAVRTEEEFNEWRSNEMRRQSMADAQATVQALVEEAQANGIELQSALMNAFQSQQQYLSELAA